MAINTSASILEARQQPARRRPAWLRPDRWVLYVLAVLAAFIFIFPIVWLVSASLKPNVEIYRAPLQLIPSQIQLDTYQRVLTATPVMRYFANSVLYATGGALLTIAFSVFAAYGLSRFSFKSKRPLLVALLIVQLVPGLVRIIPVFVMMSSLGLTNDRLGIILLYGAGGVAYGAWFLKGFVDAVPKEMDEAAWMDGASKLRTVLQIVLPALLPGLATMFILQFIGHWNDFAMASVLLRDPELTPLTVGTFRLIGPDESDFRLLASAALINIVPVIAVFSFAQRYLISGAAVGAVK
jgi:ABC-type glycerol-3-phosphate transport system permease component